MIIVRTGGGIGNQFFAYALGYALAKKHGLPLKVDTSWFFVKRRSQMNQFVLDKFNIAADVIRLPDADYQLEGANLITQSSNFEEKHLFEPIVEDKNVNIIDGLWPTEEYFVDEREELLQHLTPHFSLSTDDENTLEQLRKTNSVAIHFRGTDVARKHPGRSECSPLQHYKRSIEFIEQHVPDATFFVFSDDFRWAKAQFDLGRKVVHVTHNKPQKCHHDLYLMSQCKHFIIASSTFSWWGAWMGTAEGKIVKYPKCFHRSKATVHPDHIYNMNNVIPVSWKKRLKELV